MHFVDRLVGMELAEGSCDPELSLPAHVNWRNIAITLIDPQEGEHTAQADRGSCLLSNNPEFSIAEYDWCPMARPASLPALKRKRGNPNWGRPAPPIPMLATEFEVRVKQLRLQPEMYTSSGALRIWCEQNRNRVYIPEWLLAEWRLTVDPTSSGAA